MTYLIFLILFSTICLACVILLMYNVIKKQYKPIKLLAITMLLSSIGAACFGVLYAKQIVETLIKLDVNKEVKSASEKVGETVGSAAVGLGKGIENAVKKDSADNTK